MRVGSPQQLQQVDILGTDFSSVNEYESRQVRESPLTANCHYLYTSLRSADPDIQLCLVVRSLTTEPAKILIQAFVSCHLD